MWKVTAVSVHSLQQIHKSQSPIHHLHSTNFIRMISLLMTITITKQIQYINSRRGMGIAYSGKLENQRCMALNASRAGKSWNQCCIVWTVSVASSASLGVRLALDGLVVAGGGRAAALDRGATGIGVETTRRVRRSGRPLDGGERDGVGMRKSFGSGAGTSILVTRGGRGESGLTGAVCGAGGTAEAFGAVSSA